MQREIKFRFYDGGKMCPVGDLTFFENGTYHINEEFPSTASRYPLMQYTGVRDKWGVNIYEDDVVEYTAQDDSGLFTDRWVVKWVNDLSAYYLMHVSGKTKPDMLNEIGHDVIEIIGNVYESPDLLTQSEARIAQ